MAIKKRKTPEKPHHLGTTPKAMKYARGLAAGKRKVAAKRDAGYSEYSSPTTIESSHVFKNAQKRIMNEMERQGVNDKLLTKRLKDLLNKKQKALSFGKVITIDNIDAVAVSKGLDLAYKIKGDFAPVEVKNINPLEGMDITQLMEALQKAKQEGEFSTDFLPELLPA